MNQNEPSRDPNSPNLTQAPGSVPPPVVAASELSASEIQSRKLAAGLLGILIGGLGIHKFYLGYQQEGIVMLLVTVLGGGVGGFITCGLAFPLLVVMPTIGMVEGIIYLTKTDQDFADTYLYGRKPWF